MESVEGRASTEVAAAKRRRADARVRIIGHRRKKDAQKRTPDREPLQAAKITFR
jgi:hypothetical protein